jgi:hypothetical protein
MTQQFTSDFDEANFYQKIGEFVVSFQWTEDLIRQIGWYCIDPEFVDYPNQELRSVSNNELINKVEILHDEFIRKHGIDVSKGYQLDFSTPLKFFHTYRQFRNTLLHSAYHELKAGGKLVAMLRANPKIKTNPVTKDQIHDIGLLTPEDITKVMEKLSMDIFHLSMYFTQMKHWFQSTKSNS